MQTLLTGTLLIWALLTWTVGARTVLTGAVLRWTLLTGAVLRRTLLTRAVLSRTRLALVTLLRRAVLAGLRLSLLRVVTVLAGWRAVRRGLTLLTGGSAVLAGRRATVLLALLRWLGPVGLVGILRCDWPALLGAAWAGLRRKRTGRSLLAVRLLLTLSGMPALRGALLIGRRVLRMLAVGWLFSLVLVCRWTLTWHS